MTDFRGSASVLAVIDLEASKRFYIDKLGFEPWFDDGGWCFIKRDGVEIHLGHCPDAVPIAECPDHAWFTYITVTGIDDYYRTCLDKGVEIWHALEKKPWDMREFAIVTIDRHRIVFGEVCKL